jgi:hypothetical protein
MHVDVVALLEDGLRSVGRESLLSPGLEAHSTIALDFADTASIMIDQIDGQVWLSAALDVSEQRWESSASAVLACVSEQSDFIASRAPAVFKRSGVVDLYALVHTSFLEDSATFMRALEAFQDRVKRLVEALS